MAMIKLKVSSVSRLDKSAVFLSPNVSSSSSSSSVNYATPHVKGASLAPQEMRIDFAVFPPPVCTSCTAYGKMLRIFLFKLLKQFINRIFKALVSSRASLAFIISISIQIFSSSGASYRYIR